LGIVVRKIAPYLQDKRQDPAIVVLDEKGESVISVLSGHLGGANQLTRELAEVLGSRPVITTATDLHRKIALDLLAQEWDCTIRPWKNLKKVSAAVVNEQKVHIFSEYPLPVQETEQIQVYPLADYPKRDQGEAVVLVSSRVLNPPADKPYVFLIPKNVAVGIGCRRGTSKEKILEAVQWALQEAQICPAGVACLSSIDVKKDEQGLIAAGEELGLPIKFFSAKEIQQLEGEYAFSQLVKDKIGVNGVCEQTALLALLQGKLILTKKVPVPGVTVALAREESL